MKVNEKEESSGSECDGYLPIGIDTLCPTSVLDFDLYIRVDKPRALVLYRERNLRLDPDDLDRLRERGLSTVYIPSDNYTAYQRYLFDKVVQNTSAPPIQRYKVLSRATRSAFNAAFRSIHPGRMIQFADEFAKHMTDVVCSGELAFCEIISLMQHDHYTFTHSVNVSTCSVALANKLWRDKDADLRAIAFASLMHDIGKRRIPRFLLNKRGQLSNEERNFLKEHPRIGFEELCLREGISWGTLMTVYQHHERLSGRGYPARLTGREIHEWARICAIADVFDAMRSDRSYHGGRRLQDVLAFLEEGAGKHFDQEMIRCWSSMIKCRS